jgi:hypothetical protein
MITMSADQAKCGDVIYVGRNVHHVIVADVSKNGRVRLILRAEGGRYSTRYYGASAALKFVTVEG